MLTHYISMLSVLGSSSAKGDNYLVVEGSSRGILNVYEVVQYRSNHLLAQLPINIIFLQSIKPNTFQVFELYRSLFS